VARQGLSSCCGGSSSLAFVLKRSYSLGTIDETGLSLRLVIRGQLLCQLHTCVKMAYFLRRPSNNGGVNANQKGIVRFGPGAEPPPKPTKKGSFVALFIGAGSSSGNSQAFDNGLDPFGRLSTDSMAPPPPPSPIVDKAQEFGQSSHWTEELLPLNRPLQSYPPPPADLVARARFFLQQNDPQSVDRSVHLALYARQESEAALNAKLYNRFGDGLPLRVPGAKPVRKEDDPVPKTLREILRDFLREHDPAFLAIEGESGLDDLIVQAQEFGMDSLEDELCRKYGYGLSGKKSSSKVTEKPSGAMSTIPYPLMRDASFDQKAKAAAQSPSSPGLLSPKEPSGGNARLNKVKSEKPQTFIELDEDDSRQSMMPLLSPVTSGSRVHDFFDDKSLRADLKAFYGKHDPKKLDPQKFDPIVQWAYKIGPSELNKRFEEKYGESLTTFIENTQAGLPGVSPGAKNAAGKPADDSNEREEILVVCKNYSEKVPAKSFGECECGYSRVDHHHIASLLVPGPEEPRFNKAKPKVVISKNPKTSPEKVQGKVIAPVAREKVVFPPEKFAKQVAPPEKVVKQVAPQKAVSPPPKAIPTSPLPPPTQDKLVKPSELMSPKIPQGGPKVTPPKYKIKQEGRDGPCSDYRLDLEGKSFGVCKCGWARAEHNKAKQQVAWAVKNFN